MVIEMGEKQAETPPTEKRQLVLVYRCRSCAKVEKTDPIETTIEGLNNEIINGAPAFGGFLWRSFDLRSLHECEPEVWGVRELIGAFPAEKANDA
jgi:hypothetical protein